MTGLAMTGLAMTGLAMTTFTSLAICAAVLFSAQTASSQTAEIHGQATGWIGLGHADRAEAHAGLRYIPDLLLEQKLSETFDANMEISLNAFATSHYAESAAPAYEAQAKPYRGWIRLSTEKFEIRLGLQKINFGSAMFLRPLMWFDRVDPRDPLQLTDGVYGALARYYFLNNANIWLWGLYGNNDTKGWEAAPTQRKTPEYGGRIQSPLASGEIGATYHHRRAIAILPAANLPIARDGIPEDRFALDGKWDAGAGIWFEGVLTHQQSDYIPMKFQRQWTLGADYTFDIGNGLYAATEYFRTDLAEEPLSSGTGAGFSAFSLNYPIGNVDRVSALVYRDWTNRDWYRLLTWERTYDNWIFYILGFWNPRTLRLNYNQAGENPFAGIGAQIMIVFNH